MRTQILGLLAVSLFALSAVAGCGRAKTTSSAPPSPQAPEQQAQPVAVPDSTPPEAQPAAAEAFPLPRAVTSYDVTGEKRVIIGNPFGHVTVEPGGTQLEVKQEVYARGATEAEAKQKATTFKLVRKREEGALFLEVEGDLKNYDVGVNLLVRVPPSLNVKVRVVEGDVRVGDLQGSVEVDASAHDVTIGNVKGEVKASTSAGNLTVKGAGNGLLAQTSSGNLIVTQAQGKSVIARTMGGAIQLQATRAEKLIVTTMGGSADVTVTQPFSGNAEVRSASGDLTVTLPANSNCQVKTMTGSGPVKVTLPLREEKHEGINISGRLGAGKGLLLVSNNTGGIEVKPK